MNPPIPMEQARYYAQHVYDYTTSAFSPSFWIGLLLLALSFGDAPYLFTVFGLILVAFYFSFEYATCSVVERQATDVTSKSYAIEMATGLAPATQEVDLDAINTHSYERLQVCEQTSPLQGRIQESCTRLGSLLSKVYQSVSALSLSMCAHVIALGIFRIEPFNGLSLNGLLVGIVGMLLCGFRQYSSCLVGRCLEIYSFIACGIGIICWAASAENTEHLDVPVGHVTESLLCRIASIVYALYINRPSMAGSNNSRMTRRGCYRALGRRLTVLGAYTLFGIWMHIQPSMNPKLLMMHSNTSVGAATARFLWASGAFGLASSFAVRYYSATEFCELSFNQKAMATLFHMLPPFIGILTCFMLGVPDYLGVLSGITIVLGGFAIPLATQLPSMLRVYYNQPSRRYLYISSGLCVSYIGVTLGALILFIVRCTMRAPLQNTESSTLSTYLPHNSNALTSASSLQNHTPLTQGTATANPLSLYNRTQPSSYKTTDKSTSRGHLENTRPKQIIQIEPPVINRIHDCIEHAHLVNTHHQSILCKAFTVTNMFDHCQMMYFAANNTIPVFNTPGIGIWAIIDDANRKAASSNAEENTYDDMIWKSSSNLTLDHFDNLQGSALISIRSKAQLARLIEAHQRYAVDTMVDIPTCSSIITKEGYYDIFAKPHPHVVDHYRITKGTNGDILVKATSNILLDECLEAFPVQSERCATISEILLRTCMLVQPRKDAFDVIYRYSDSLWYLASFESPSENGEKKQATPSRSRRIGRVRRLEWKPKTGESNGELGILYENIASTILSAQKTENISSCQVKTGGPKNTTYQISVILQSKKIYRLQASNTTAEILDDLSIYSKNDTLSRKALL